MERQRPYNSFEKKKSTVGRINLFCIRTYHVTIVTKSGIGKRTNAQINERKYLQTVYLTKDYYAY